MGLLNFVKSAGAKIFGATETAAGPPRQREQVAAKHGLDASQLEAKPEVKSEGDKAVLPRRDAPTEAAEKVAPATAASKVTGSPRGRASKESPAHTES